MEYGNLIRQAWMLTWRHRFLWLLALLAGGAVGVPSLGSGGTSWRTGATRGDTQAINQWLADAPRALESWMLANATLLITLAAVGVALVLLLVLLSFVAQGSMARATADLVAGRRSSLRAAWSAGLHTFWRYVGLWLLLVAATVVIAATLAAVIGALVVAFTAGVPAIGGSLAIAADAVVVIGFTIFVLSVTRDAAMPRWAVALGAAAFALPVVTVLVVVGLTMSIVVAFAQRAIVVEDVGPMEALRSGWRLARAHLGESVLTWLVNLALAFVAGAAVVTGVIAALVVFGGIGVLMYVFSGLSPVTLAYAIVFCVALTAGVLTLAGIANAFFWTFWTLVYLRLSGRPTLA